MVTKTCDFKQYAMYVSALKQLKTVAHINIYAEREREKCALLGYYAASSGNFSPMFWNYLSVASSGFKNLWILSWTERMELIGCPKTSVRNYHYSLHNKPEECSSQLLCGGSLKSLIYIYTHTHTHTHIYTHPFITPLCFNAPCQFTTS